MLSAARQKAGLTQREASLRLKRSRSFVHKVELGERTLSFLEFLDYAKVLGDDPFDLMDQVLNYPPKKPELESVIVTAAPRKPKKKKK